MQVDAPYPRLSPYFPHQKHLRAAVCCSVLAFASTPRIAHAADNFVLVDTQMIAALQLRAQQASPREQVQLYADLANKISVLVTKQIADGDDDKAQETLHQLELCTAQIETDLQRDSKGLKKTELLLHDTNRRLADLMRSASGDMKPVVQSALRRLDKAQATLLSAVFEK